MTEHIVLRTLADMTLANAERLAFDHANVEIGDEAVATVAQGRVRFESYLDAMRRLHALLRASSEDMTSQEHAEFEATP